MCWACNPTCGKCRPAKRRSVLCPECGGLSFYDRTAMLSDRLVECPKCGFDVTALVHVEPAFCGKVGTWCGFPCQRSADPLLEGFACPYITPVEEAAQEMTS